MRVRSVVTKGFVSVGGVSHRDGQAQAVDPDAQLVGRLTAVLVGQVLHELGQVHLLLGVLPAEMAQALRKRRRLR